MTIETIFLYLLLLFSPFAGWGAADLYAILTHTHAKVK